jgi:hypothetical protein
MSTSVPNPLLDWLSMLRDWLWIGLAVVACIASWVSSAISSIPWWLWFAVIVFWGLDRVAGAVRRVSKQLRSIGGQLEELNDRLSPRFPDRHARDLLRHGIDPEE